MKALLEKEERKTMQAAKCSSHQLRKRGRLGRKAPAPEKKKAVSKDQEGCGQTSQQTSPDWFESKRTCGLNKLMSIVHRMSMELESKFLDS